MNTLRFTNLVLVLGGILLATLVLSAVGCAPAQTPIAPPSPTTVPAPLTTAPTEVKPTVTAPPTLAPGQREFILMGHDSFNASETVIAEFEKANNAKVRILKAGDAGAALNKAILAKNNPLADAFFGGGHEMVIARRHYKDGATLDTDLYSSGEMTEEEHYWYFKLTIDSIRDIILNNRYVRYISVFQNWLRAYGKQGQTCERCGSTFVRTVVAGRGTSYCPGCQH